MKILLFQPRIPQNAGNIVRTCAVTASELVMVRPLGFSTSDRMLKRAGLDYWEGVNISIIDDLFSYLEKYDGSFYFFSTKGAKPYSEIQYQTNDLLIFGSEIIGLPEEVHKKWPEKILTIPMKTNCRSLNVSNSVAIVLYESLRQNNFSSLQ